MVVVVFVVVGRDVAVVDVVVGVAVDVADFVVDFVVVDFFVVALVVGSVLVDDAAAVVVVVVVVFDVALFAVLTFDDGDEFLASVLGSLLTAVCKFEPFKIRSRIARRTPIKSFAFSLLKSRISKKKLLLCAALTASLCAFLRGSLIG